VSEKLTKRSVLPVVTAKPVVKTVAKPVAKSATKPAAKAVAKPVVKAVARPAEPVIAQPIAESVPAVLKNFFRVSDSWELSEIQQCRLLRCPSAAVLRRYRAGQGPRLTPAQQKRIQIITGIHAALSKNGLTADRAYRWIHEARKEVPFKGETPVHFMMEGGVDALVEVAHLLSGR